MRNANLALHEKVGNHFVQECRDSVQKSVRGHSYRCQLVKAGKKFIEGHHQLLRRALGRQARETLDVGK